MLFCVFSGYVYIALLKECRNNLFVVYLCHPSYRNFVLARDGFG